MRNEPHIIRLSELRKETRDRYTEQKELPPLPPEDCPVEHDDNEHDLLSFITGA